MKIGSKTYLKLFAVVLTAFQAYSLYLGQSFHAWEYATAVALLFGSNTLHEKFVQPTDGDCK